MRVVLDANVVFAGVGWRGEAHHCLVAMAKKQITVFATLEILAEVRSLAAEKGGEFKDPASNLITWYYDRGKLVGARGSPVEEHQREAAMKARKTGKTMICQI